MKKLIVIFSVALLIFISAAAVYAKGAEPVGVGIGISSTDDGEVQYCGAEVHLVDGSVYKFEGTYKVNVANNGGNGQGNIVFHCKGTLITEPPQSAVRGDGKLYSSSFSCWNGNRFINTTNWWLDITPSGQASYKCHVNPSN